MAKSSAAPKTTRSSPLKGSSKPGSWKSELIFSAKKTCEHCGAEYRPWMKLDEHGNLISGMKPGLWKKQRFCSISCSKKHENPMVDPVAVAKMTATLKRIGHQPKERWGNGCGLTRAQEKVLKILGEGWIAEHPVPSEMPRGSAHPTVYKIDLANPQLMIGIELDGNSHAGKRKAEDERKDARLEELGWRIFRVKNRRAESLCLIFKSPDTLLTSLMGS
jgi:hypothetical protein